MPAVNAGEVWMVDFGLAAKVRQTLLLTSNLLWLERLAAKGPKSESWSSMVLAGDLIYILNQSGDCVVLKTSPKFEVMSTNAVGNEMCNASVAVSDGELFIRTHKHLWCIGETKMTASVR